MREYADLHCHILYGTDDGATDEAEMYAMLDMMYADGARAICTTPHFNSVIWGDNRKNADEAYNKLCIYAKTHYPDLRLFRGNELGYQYECIEELSQNRCLTLGESRYVLVDFSFDATEYEISNALHQLAGHGFPPILAHAERYTCFFKNIKKLAEYKENIGALLQVNAASLKGRFGSADKRQAKKMIRLGLVDVVASDAHHTSIRSPGMSEAYDFIAAKCGTAAAEELCCNNPLHILDNTLAF